MVTFSKRVSAPNLDVPDIRGSKSFAEMTTPAQSMANLGRSLISSVSLGVLAGGYTVRFGLKETAQLGMVRM